MLLASGQAKALVGEDFEFFRRSIRERAGIVLSDAKKDLLQSRLRSRILQLGMSGFDEYRHYLQSLKAGDFEWQVFINLLTTNKTDWFREPDHFDFLVNTYLPIWLKKRSRCLKIWCAASSTGQEAYTLALLLHYHLQGRADFEIFASDIDTTVLDYARNGVYPKNQVVTTVPQPYVSQGFVFGKAEISEWVKVRKEIRSRVNFGQVNLLQHPFPFAKSFDLIFCRNVFIYFSQETIGRVISAQYDVTSPSGLLIIGHSESLQASAGRWSYVRPSIYVKGSL